jgi:hypothetical protein
MLCREALADSTNSMRSAKLDHVQSAFRRSPVGNRAVKTLRVLVGAALAAVALAGSVQSRPWRAGGGQPAHAWGGAGHPARPWGGGERAAPQGGGFGRSFQPAYPGRGYAPQPAYPGRGYGGYPPARFSPAPGPAPYGPPAGGGWRQTGAWRQQEEFLRQGVRQGQLAPLGSVIQNLRHIAPGRQLDSGLEYMGPRLVYRVRWMTANGRVVDYFADATTGAILSGR